MTEVADIRDSVAYFIGTRLLDNGHYNYTITILQLTSHAATISHALNMSRHGLRCRSTDNVLLIVGSMRIVTVVHMTIIIEIWFNTV